MAGFAGLAVLAMFIMRELSLEREELSRQHFDENRAET
jgi:hypothetical protein